MWPFSDRDIASHRFERIVVRVPNPLGDQIMATPALDALRRRYPGAHLAAYGTQVAADLYAGMDWFDDFFVVGRRESAWAQARRLRAGNYDACVLLAGSFRTALPPFLARIPHRIGYRWSGRTVLLTAHWHRPRPGGKKQPYPTKHYFLDLVANLGCTGGGRVTLALTDAERAKTDAWLVEERIGADEPLFLMCVGAAFGPSKLWPAPYFAAVADHMAERWGARVVVLCAPGEEAIGEAVRAHARRPLVDTGKNPLRVETLKGLIARAKVLLTNDTGPRHIAASFLVPVVCLMGPTSHVYTDTDMEEQVVLREDGIDCAPCHKKVCPIDHRCLVRITPDRAIAEVERIWKKRSRPAGAPS
jgi:heptosyltransferase-2